MNRVALGAAVLAFSALGAIGGLCAKHEREKRGGQRRRGHEGRAGAQCLRLQRRQYFSVVELERGAERDQELGHHQLRSGCADGQRLVALGGVQHSGGDDFDPEECRRRQGEAHAAGAIQSRTDFGTSGYGGPCPPPDGTSHRYIFTVFAVDVDKLPDAKDENASAALVGYDLHFHTLAKAILTATYSRSK